VAIESFQTLDRLLRPSDVANRNPIGIVRLMPHLNRFSDYDNDNDNDNDNDGVRCLT
jgi:hypothetical protein